MLYYVIIMLMGISFSSVDTLIQKLNPDVSIATRTMVAETIVTYAPKSGFKTQNDAKLILAIIQTESNFIHKKEPGIDNEWGMMQVIPGDTHIKISGLRYICTNDERDAYADGFKLCNGMSPNILSGGRVNPYKLATLIKLSPRAGIAIGIMEMAVWKKKYESRLKAKFWDTQRQIPIGFIAWHSKVKRELGENVWVVHYNYGNRIKFSPIGLAYPLNIIKNVTKMD